MGNKASKLMMPDNPQYQDLRRGYERMRSKGAHLEELAKNEQIRALIVEGTDFVRGALWELEKHMDKDGPMKNGHEKRKHRRRHTGHHRRHGRHKHPDSESASLDGMSKPWKHGHQEGDFRDQSPHHRYPIGERNNMGREFPLPGHYGRVQNEHGNMMPDSETRAHYRFEGVDDPRMRDMRIPRHQAPGPTAAMHPGRGMPGFPHPSARHRAPGMGNAYRNEYVDKRRSGHSTYPSKANLRSKSRLERQSLQEEFHTAPLAAEEDSEESSEVTIPTSNDSDPPPPPQQEPPQIQVQDDLTARPTPEFKERSGLRPPSKRPIPPFLASHGRQYSRRTMSGAL